VIKIASMVGAPDLQSPTLAPYSGDLESAFQNLSAMGYDGIELMLLKPAQMDGVLLRQLLDQNHLHLVALCTGHVFGDEKLGLVRPDLQIDPDAMQRAKEFVNFAGTYFEPGTMINFGRFRGLADPSRPEESIEVYTTAFQQIADYAASTQVRLILEPVSKSEVNFLHSSQDGLQMVRMVDRPNFGVMLDTYHMQREDKDILESLHEAGPLCWHMHFSDSNRCYPGSADIPFDRVVETLNRIGYEGYVGTEIKNWPDSETAARNSITYLRRWIPVSSEPKVTNER
jgi:sugar phosphate isomerase/epimerase